MLKFIKTFLQVRPKEWFNNLTIFYKLMILFVVFTIFFLYTTYLGIYSSSKLVQQLNSNSPINGNNINSLYNSEIIWLIFSALLGLIVAFIVCFLIASSISKRVNHLLEVLSKMHGGDYTVSIDVKSNDEIGKISGSINELISEQREVLFRVVNSTGRVDSESQKLNGATVELTVEAKKQEGIINGFTTTIEQLDISIQDVATNMAELATNVGNVSNSIEEMGTSAQETARNVEEAAVAVNQVSLSIGQMDESIRSITQNSKEVEKEAEKTVEKAKEGSVAVSAAIEEMDKINGAISKLATAIEGLGNSAKSIEDIVGVIDDIADQTNLLSLNAAIEAARAGDAGKGFAVVAGEVRKLAEKSGESAKDITKLIKQIQFEVEGAVNLTGDSAKSVQAGVEQVKNTNLVFSEIFSAIDKTSKLVRQITMSISEQQSGNGQIIKSVDKMNELISQLSAASEQQAAGSDDIVKSVQKIDDVIQQMSATTQEQSASSEEVTKLLQGVSLSIKEIFSTIVDISTSTNGLSERIQKLAKVVNMFKVN